MKIGVIGYGGMAEHHVNHYIKGYNTVYGASCGAIEVCGIYDISAERIEKARKSGLYIYESAEALLGDKSVSAVLIATPNDSHCAYAVSAANAKKHILLEKPAALNSGEVRQMYAAAEKNGVLLIVNQNRRWDSDYLTVKKIAEQNMLGGIYSVESRVMGSNGIPGAWRKAKAQGGGMLLDWGVHQIDQLLTFIPSPVTSVYCRMSYIAGEEVDDAYYLTLTFANGVTALVVTDTNTFTPLPRWQVYGMGGTAVIEDWDLKGKLVVVNQRVDDKLKSVPAGNGFTKTMAKRRAETVTALPLPAVEPDAFALYKNFALSALGRETPVIKKDEVLRTFAVMEAAFESAERNEVIKREI